MLSETHSVKLKIEIKSGNSIENELKDINIDSDTELVINGQLNDDDIAYLGKYTRRIDFIRKIDLSDVYGLDAIDHNAFELCTSLEEITIPSNINTIGDHAFDSCKRLKSIVMPNGIKHIGDRAFSGCEELVSINIPQSVTYIGIGTFFGCYKLTNMQVDENNNRYVYYNDVLFDKVDRTLIKYLPNKIQAEEFVIPNDIIHIGNYAFDGCFGLKTVIVNEGCTDLGERSFISCKNLKRIDLSSSINNMVYNGFENCEQLEEINVSENNKKYSSFDGILFSKDQTEIVLFPKSKKSPVFFPNTVRKVNEGAFYGCSNIKTIILPQNTETIGNYAFCNCFSLRYISLPNKLSDIGSFAFSNCSSLKKIKINTEIPPKCGVSAIDTNIGKKCTVYLPIDAEFVYRKEYGWELIENYEETFFMTLCSNFPSCRKLILYTKKIWILFLKKVKSRKS